MNLFPLSVTAVNHIRASLDPNQKNQSDAPTEFYIYMFDKQSNIQTKQVTVPLMSLAASFRHDGTFIPLLRAAVSLMEIKDEELFVLSAYFLNVRQRWSTEEDEALCLLTCCT